MAFPFRPATAVEVAPLLTLFGPLASRVGELIRADPSLAPRFMLSPPRAVHAMAAYIHTVVTGSGLANIAEVIGSTHPRDLLRNALPVCDARLYRMLDRATLPAWSQSDYEALDEVLRSEIADVLPSRGQIAPSLVREAQALLKSGPVLRRARRACLTTYERDRLDAVVRVLDHLGLLRDLGMLPDKSGPQAVARRVAADFGRAEAPEIDFPIPPGWTRIRRPAELWRHGDRMNLCLRPGQWGAGDYAISLLLNRSVFLFHAEPEVLAQYRKMPGGTWALGQCVTANNGRPPNALVRALTTDIENAGIVLLPAPLGDALDSVLRPLRSKDREARLGMGEYEEDDPDLPDAADGLVA